MSRSKVEAARAALAVAEAELKALEDKEKADNTKRWFCSDCKANFDEPSERNWGYDSNRVDCCPYCRKINVSKRATEAEKNYAKELETLNKKYGR